ncbi:hypothetical protein V2J09_014976 [Rumex salicifolius]
MAAAEDGGGGMVYVGQGSGSMVSFDDLCTRKRSQTSFFCTYDGDDNGSGDFDAYSQQKKRRLTSEQVRFLETSFETDNKLEPERKTQLAKDLGLQPRQVAIWFQNRRARWKTKQIEKDFDILQANFNTLKTEYDILLKENDTLKAEVLWLSDKLQAKEQALETEIRTTASSASDDEAPEQMLGMVCKQEDPSSARSDVLDSDSPHYISGPYSSAFAEPIDALCALDLLDDDISLNPSFMSSSVYVLPKIEILDDYHDNPPGNACHFASPVDDQDSWFWSY